MTPGSVIAQSCGCICPPPQIDGPQSHPLGQVYKVYAACPVHGFKAWGKHVAVNTDLIADVPAGVSEEGLRDEIAKALCDYEFSLDMRQLMPWDELSVEARGEWRVRADIAVKVFRRLSPSADLLKAAKAEERERCARILDNEAAKWVESKKRLRPLDEVPAAHARFWNYIENAKRLAIAIRNTEGDEG